MICKKLIVNYSFSMDLFEEITRHERDPDIPVVFPDGSKQWYLSNKLHRLDGPAIVKVDGTEEWWYNGSLQKSKINPCPIK